MMPIQYRNFEFLADTVACTTDSLQSLERFEMGV